jgi:hypothetical protein
LLAALLGFAVYAGTVTQAAATDAQVGQPQAVRSERLSTDFVFALSLWVRSVQEQAGGTNAVLSPVGGAAAFTDTAAAMGLQSALLQSPIGTASQRLLQRVIDDRADVAAARDLVVQLRMAGETKRADAEFETRLQPMMSRLLQDATLLKTDLREAADIAGHWQQHAAQMAARSVQVVLALGLAALMLAVAALRWGVRSNVEARGPHQEPPADRPAAALTAQALLQRALRPDLSRDGQARASKAVRQPVGVE